MTVLTQSCTKIKKMGSKHIFAATILACTLSCTAEKMNLSPVSDGNLSAYQQTGYTERVDQINYTSEITNLLSTFPKFKNDAVNQEVSQLKYFLKDYIGGFQAYNFAGMNKSHSNYEKSYKKLQKLKVYLNPDEAEVLNRYLVRIKSTMNILQEEKNNHSVSLKENN